jgi:FixJ family two-component response regulator
MPDSFPIVALIDDDHAARKALARLLATQRYRVKQFASAQQYLDTSGDDEAFCAVIDINLGVGMSGLDLAREIKASARPIPIIFITGSIDGALRVKAWEIGCVDFLEKPCRAEDLVAAVNAAFSVG